MLLIPPEVNFILVLETYDVRAKSRFGSDVVFYDCLENLVISYSK